MNFQSRPFGVAILFAGIDERGPQLYHMDPSGTFVQFDAKAIGSGSEGAQQSLQEVYHKVQFSVFHVSPSGLTVNYFFTVKAAVFDPVSEFHLSSKLNYSTVIISDGSDGHHLVLIKKTSSPKLNLN